MDENRVRINDFNEGGNSEMHNLLKEKEKEENLSIILNLRDQIKDYEEEFCEIRYKYERLKKKGKIKNRKKKRKIKKLEKKASELKYQQKITLLEYEYRIALLNHQKEHGEYLLKLEDFYRVRFMALAGATQDIAVRAECEKIVAEGMKMCSREMIGNV